MKPKKQTLKILFFLSLLYFGIQSLNAQDHIISVFSTSQLTINPATTGTFGNSNLRVYSGLNWNTYSGYFSEKTMTISADKTLLKGILGVGCNFSYEFGDDIVKSNGAMLSAAYNTEFLNDNYKFSIGMQAGLMQNSVDWDRLYFDAPLSSRYIDIFSDSLGPAKEHIRYPDFNLGVLVFRNSDKSKSKIMPWLGVSVSHLFQPNVSFFSLSSPLPRKLTINAGADIPVNQHIVLTPLLLYTNQDYFKALDMGGSAKYQKGSFSVSLGGIYMNAQEDIFNTEQLSLLAGLGYAGFEFRMELFVLGLNYANQMDYSRGFIGLSWNLHERKNRLVL